MKQSIIKSIPGFLDVLGLDEEPMGIYFTNERPVEGISPKPTDIPTLEKEIRNEVDWQTVFSKFSCVMGKIRRARKKKTAAYFTAEQFGCCGGAFRTPIV